ncbi:pentatricopeptide repeat-containing protein At2g13600 isoform X1 [Selaginella moellendorffii]|uniref:pentatricopeptide repeat-containing protein At2g13600 isoform X1 n=1 Tax=Selaginella moellendorffii TaxID=88036 RepID=UPI000D1C5FA1|nr:pentatricopeptide repeat-containing protein At2g13600 isoform X1 [Selaginella moellendorffii]XP_024538786.1 pentatricopeptide repeat-containing protein At2g13600 isoform X1 [Selaginella moellendorffii]XP_024538787.1 pentatricopeptide repeat-containing protein At2g13600 isoform X1 [Selaginella moellendorffii]XP_024538788.1 pentatricopeptide repeat-containing protein At2g13600 isoform X1 [Selaginella moellendorffii]|eukprot:XP_024538785.1 pentatricopeptide repeat-containing protein At2g13600 isoform X1 [Selaginella moellendorffii]
MEKSIAVCHSARDQGVNPGVGAVLAAIKACKRSRDLESGRMIHRDAAKNGDLDAHPAIASSLIDMYAKCGSAMEARGVFESIRQRDVVSWNCIIQGLALNGDGDAALGYFDRFVQEGGGSDSSCRPDHVTFLAALKACSSLIERSRGRGSRARFLARIQDIHARAARFGELSEIFLASSLTDSYAKCGSLVDAQLVFESMDSRNAVSWTAVILGFAETGQADLALEFYAAMQEEGCDPDRVTVLAALKACASLGESSEQWRSSLSGCLRRGRQVHGQALKGGYELEKFVGNALVDMYSKCGSMEDARRVFDALRKPSVVSWSSLILGYARCGQGELSLDLYSRMRGDGYVPNAVTYLAALKACVSLAERASGDGGDSSKPVHGRESEDKVLKRKWLEIGRGIHSQAAADGLGRDLFVSNALVDMYAKCGSVEEARRVFDGMTDRDSVSWTAIIQSYVQVGESEQALRLFTRMRGEGLVADAVTFVAALKACASLGALEKGREIYKELQRAGLDSNTFVWTCLIDFFGKCGSMAEAEQVTALKETPTACLICSRG